jgi:prepilin peptidase CpaA
LVGMSVAAGIFDARIRKIPNWLTGLLVVAAIGMHVPLGIAAVGDALLTMTLVFLAGAVLFRAGAVGGGDVKLLTGCAGMVGLQALPALLLAIFGAGAILALAHALARGRLRALLLSTAGVAAGLRPADPSLRVPYGIAVAAGCCFYSLPHALRAG